MIMLLKINIMIKNEVVDTSRIINNKVSLSGSSNSKADDDMKDLINRTRFGDDLSILNLIKYRNQTEISDCNKILLNLIDMNVEGLSNISYEKLLVEETVLKKQLSVVTFSSYSYNAKCYINNITKDL